MRYWSKHLALLFISTLGMLVAADSEALAANDSERAGKTTTTADRVKTLTLRQNHYVLGEITVDLTKDALRLYSALNDVTIMVSAPEYKVREFSIGRKIIFERTLDDFCSHGSSANWDYDENILRLPWFPCCPM